MISACSSEGSEDSMIEMLCWQTNRKGGFDDKVNWFVMSLILSEVSCDYSLAP